MNGYYFVTDSSLSRNGNLHDVACAQRAGVALIQYRNKTGSTADMVEEARRMRTICTSSRLLINDRIDVALAVNADGVHIGQDDMPCELARQLLGPDKLIGVTVHNVAEAIAAQHAGADYLGVSPIFSTSTKSDAGAGVGLSLVRDVRALTPLPIIAIGGIHLGNAPDVIATGANGLCAISAVVTTHDVEKAIGEFQNLFPSKHPARIKQ